MFKFVFVVDTRSGEIVMEVGIALACRSWNWCLCERSGNSEIVKKIWYWVHLVFLVQPVTLERPVHPVMWERC